MWSVHSLLLDNFFFFFFFGMKTEPILYFRDKNDIV